MHKHFDMDFHVFYHDINKHKEAKPTAILNYLQEAAYAHSEAIGYGLDRLQSLSVGWVLNHLLLEILQYPLLNEKIIVETWTSDFRHFYGAREFLIKDKRQNIIGKATTLWVFLDIEKKKPTRVIKPIMELWGSNHVKAIDKPQGHLEVIDCEDSENVYNVLKSDIDTNNHVNHIRYVEWMLETLPVDLHDNYFMNKLEIMYKKEVEYDSIVKSACKSIDPDCYNPQYLHNIRCTDLHCIAASAKTSWLKR